MSNLDGCQLLTSDLTSTGPNFLPYLTTIAVLLTNTEALKVQNSTILEG